jgi:hypothetical protein
VVLLPETLVDISLKTLPTMIAPEKNQFCKEVKINKFSLLNNAKISQRSISLRYTIISLLGFTRAQQSGYQVGIDIDYIFKKLLDFTSTMNIGDLGLLLWLGNRVKCNINKNILFRIRAFLAKKDLHNIVGWEIAWLIVGLLVHSCHNSDESKDLADSLARYVLDNRSAPSGLFYEKGKGIRRRFPSFATQIYMIHALSMKARHHSDKQCGDRAVKAAEYLSKLQLPNGGWGWIYDAKRGTVVEPFEIYSVHQDAMAPMAFHELTEATGYDTKAMIHRSLNWLDDENELGINMVDEKNGFIYRSIRRKAPFNNIPLYARTMASTFGINLGNKISNSHLELNMTCRPYHLGWILEAWCGRNVM